MKTNRTSKMKDAEQRKAHEKWLATVAERQKIFGADIVEHLKECQRLKDNTRRYFQGSRFWRALQRHIESDKDCIIERPGAVLTHSAGSGVRFKSACAPWCSQGEPQTISLEFEVEFVPDSEDPGYDTFQVGGGGTHRTFFVYLPAELEVNFTEEKFKIWLNQQRKVRDEARLEKNKKSIKWLLDNCPRLLLQMVKDHEKKKRLNRS